MTATWVDFRALRARLAFADVLRSYDVQLKVRGALATGFCPLPGHDGKRRSPSFSANLERGIFQCFGCGAKGNVLDFAALMDGQDPADANALRAVALRLQQRVRISGDPPRRPGATARSTEPAATAKPTPETPAVPAVVPTIVNASLDFELQGLDPHHPYLASRGFTAETVAQFGLGYCGRGMMNGRIAIPLHDAGGRLIGYAGRLVDDAAISETHPKYRFPGDRVRDGKLLAFKKSLFVYNGYRLAPNAERLVVVEGFPSVWHLWQHGFRQVVAVMGSACSAEQGRLIVSSLAPGGRVEILTDGDDAGTRCAEAIFREVATFRDCRWRKLAAGKQPTDLSRDDLFLLLDLSAAEAS